MGAMIELTASDGHTLAAYTAGPAPAGTKGLVVIQEIFGVNSHMRRVCDMYAAEGYSVVAPALFDRAERGAELGYEAEDMTRGRELRSQVPEAGMLADVAAAKAHLAGASSIGIVGYCWGGSVAWLGNTRLGFDASSSYYGGQIVDAREEAANGPAMMHFGTEDASIPMSDVELIRAAQPGVAIHVYEGAQHGFCCDDRATFSAPDCQQANERTLEFFARVLG